MEWEEWAVETEELLREKKEQEERERERKYLTRKSIPTTPNDIHMYT